MKNHPLLSKILMIIFLILLMQVPLLMIESKISERSAMQTRVQQEIARQASGAQTLTGPYLVLSYKVQNRFQNTEIVLPPHNLKINGNVDVETRHRGIYQARLYNLKSKISGDFVVPRAYGSEHPAESISPQSAYVVMKISDSRGIRNIPLLNLNGQTQEFLPGVQNPLAGNGMYAAIKTPDATQNSTLNFDFTLDLQGLSTLSVAPTGDLTEMKLASSWPHPSFGGSFLPRKHEISDEGFSAQWSVSKLSRNNATASSVSQSQHTSEVFSVDFIDPVNIYLLAERAVKYGLMFLVLVFSVFFLFELLRGLRIHAMQYLLVGLAMAVFFLLLISLSEHIAFPLAYLLSGGACVALLGAYLSGVLRSVKPALAFSSGIALLYAVLYGVLQSEDNALLMGALLLFAVLAMFMLSTRHLDWYRLSQTANPVPETTKN